MPKAPKNVRTVVRVETPEKHKQELARLQGEILRRREELSRLRHLGAIEKAVEAAQLELKMVLESRERAEKDVEMARARADNERKELKRRAWEIKQAEVRRVEADRSHRERVAADRAQLDLRRREIAAEEDRLVQACEAAARQEESARNAEKDVCAAADRRDRLIEKAKHWHRRAFKRIVVAAYVESMIRRQRQALTVNIALYQAIVHKARRRMQDLRAERRGYDDERKAINEARKRLDAQRDAVLALEKKTANSRQEIDKIMSDMKAREREQKDVDREQAKREAKLLAWESRNKSQSQRLSRVSETLGKKLNAEGQAE